MIIEALLTIDSCFLFKASVCFGAIFKCLELYNSSGLFLAFQGILAVRQIRKLM